MSVAGKSCLGAVLAGGRSRRMGGDRKALLELDGKPLVRHVIERLEPQVERLVLSVETMDLSLDFLGLDQVPDPVPGSRGPLGGLAAALGLAVRHGFDWLVVAPCDSPFLPGDLCERLVGAAVETGEKIAVARDSLRVQPAFSAWRGDMLDEVSRAVADRGLAGFFQLLDGCPHCRVDWPETAPPPFYNINDPAGLERARAWLKTEKEGKA